MAVLTYANYNNRGDGIAGALNGIDVALGVGSTTQSNILDINHPVNSAANKFRGRRVMLTDRDGIIVTASGSNPSDPWITPDRVYEAVPS